jgi:hypothetical protein
MRPIWLALLGLLYLPVIGDAQKIYLTLGCLLRSKQRLASPTSQLAGVASAAPNATEEVSKHVAHRSLPIIL